MAMREARAVVRTTGPELGSVSLRAGHSMLAVTFLLGSLVASTAASASTSPVTQWAAVNDTFVRSDQPTRSYGGSKYLYADGWPEKRIYLRFTVTDAPAGPQHTVLRLRQTTANPYPAFCDDLAPTETGDPCFHYIRVSVRRVGAGAWDESTTWLTAPPVGEVIGTAPNELVRGFSTLVDIDLGMFVDGDGSYEVAVTGDNNTNYTFQSRENNAAPLLVLVP